MEGLSDSRIKVTGLMPRDGNFCGEKRKQTEPGISGESRSKQRKVATTPPQMLVLEYRGSAYFLPDFLKEQACVLSPPSREARKQINDYQIDHLETRDSAIHNRGVHLKRYHTQPVKEGQVVAIYEGHLLQCRHLTPEEKKGAGLLEDAVEQKTTDDIPKTHARKQLVWYHEDNETRLINRPPSFQAYSVHFRYKDDGNRTVWLGIDGLDSPYPISDINSSKEHANIIMVPCVSEYLIAEAFPEGAVNLIRRPEPGEYCLLSVANKSIQPGAELLLDYQAAHENPGRKAYFWGPEDYFFPVVSPVPMQVEFSDDHGTVSLVPAAQQPSLELAALKKDIEDYFERERSSGERRSLAEMIYDLHRKHKNPLTGKKLWTPGCIQFLLELWNIERMRSYSQLTRLTHCLGSDGKLDHEGVNYFYGFQKKRAPSVGAPVNKPACIRDVIKWLDDSIAQLERQDCDNDQQQELGYLQNQRQQLQTWLCRNTNDYTEKQKMLAEEEVKIRDFIDGKINRLTTNKESGVVSPLVELTTYYLHPHELWPDQMKTSVWRNAHIRCKFLSQSGLAKFCAQDPLDTLHCYNPRLPEYAHAMKEAIARVRNEGITLEIIKSHGIHNCLHLSREQVVGQGQGTGTFGSDSKQKFVIPYIEGIPVELHGTTRWSALTDAQWSLLDVDASVEGHLLKTTLERLCHDRKYEWTRYLLCKHAKYIRTWAYHPDIKEAFKTGKTFMRPLFHHLIKLSGTEIKELTSHWQPLDSLIVCKADTPIYNEAMNVFLEQQLKEGKNARIIAGIFNNPDPYKQHCAIPEDIELARKVEKPSDVATSGDWTGEDVMAAINSRQIPTPTSLEIQNILLSKFAAEYAKVSQAPREKLNYQTVKSRIQRVINELPDELLTSIAEEYGLNKGNLKPLRNNAVIRYLVTILNIAIPDDSPELQKEMTLRGMDKLIAISQQHPDWRTELTNLISRLRSRGLNDSTIADLFNSGNSNVSHQCDVLFPALPLPPKCTNDCWNADIIVTFFLETRIAQLDIELKKKNELLKHEQEKAEKVAVALKKAKEERLEELKRLQDDQNTALEKTKSDHQKKKKELEASYSEKLRKHSFLRSQLKRALDEKRNEYTLLESESREQKNEIDKKSKEYALLESESRKQSYTLKKVKSDLNRITGKYNKLFALYEKRKQEIKNLHTALTERTESLTSEEESYLKQGDTLLAAQHKHTEELERLKEENKLALEKADLEHQENIENLKIWFCSKIEEFKQELQTVTLGLKEKDEKLRRLQQEINKQAQFIKEKETELQEVRFESQRRFNDLQTKTQEIQKITGDLQEKTKFLVQKNTEVLVLDEELAKVKEEWSKQVQNLKEENMAALENAELKYNRQQEKNRSLNLIEVSSLKSSFQEVKKTLDVKEKECDSLKQQEIKLTQLLKEKEAEFHKKRSEVKSCLKNIHEKNQKIERITNDLNEKAKSLEKNAEEISSITVAFESAKLKHSKKIGVLNEEAKVAMSKAKSDHQQELADIKKHYKAEIVSLNEAFDQLRVERDEKQEELISLQLEISNYSQSLQEKEDELLKMRVDYQNSLETIQSINQEVEYLKSDLKVNNDLLNLAKEDLSNARLETLQQKEKYESQVMQHQEQEKQLEAKCSELEKVEETHVQEIKHLERQRDQQSSQVSSYSVLVSMLNTLLTQHRSNVDKEHEELSRQHGLMKRLLTSLSYQGSESATSRETGQDREQCYQQFEALAGTIDSNKEQICELLDAIRNGKQVDIVVRQSPIEEVSGDPDLMTADGASQFGVTHYSPIHSDTVHSTSSDADEIDNTTVARVAPFSISTVESTSTPMETEAQSSTVQPVEESDTNRQGTSA